MLKEISQCVLHIHLQPCVLRLLQEAPATAHMWFQRRSQTPSFLTAEVPTQTLSCKELCVSLGCSPQEKPILELGVIRF